jgi:hypothetical protein
MPDNGELRAAEFQGKVLEALEHLEHQMGKNAASLSELRTAMHAAQLKVEHRITTQEVRLKGIAAAWAIIAAFASSLVLALISWRLR